jgi:hypothetical protein
MGLKQVSFAYREVVPISEGPLSGSTVYLWDAAE